MRTERPIEAKATATMSMTPAPDAGPIVVMPLHGGVCSPDAPKVAVIDLDGPLLNQNFGAVGSYGENPVNIFREKLAVAESTPGVIGIVLRVNTPGGSVAATEIMVSNLRQFKERRRVPIVACVLDVGAGGGYYLTSMADHVIAYPSSLVGGIGVIINLYNLRETLGTWNVLPQSIKSGDNIDMGTVNEALTPEADTILKNLAREFHEAFIQDVRKDREGLPAPPSEIYDGRIYSGRQAVKVGLIDRIGTLEDALSVAAEMGGCPGATPVLLHRPGDVGRTPYAVTRNESITKDIIPLSIPGLSQREMPTFLYMWDPLPASH